MNETADSNRGVARWGLFSWRFSLRTMLVVVLVCCVGFGWWRDRNQFQQRVQQLEYELMIASRKADAASWSHVQSLGEPDTPGSGDIRSAWASATQDGQAEWLLLDYQHAVKPAMVEIHENFNPGAVVKVSVFDGDGKEVVLWQGVDPTPPDRLRGVSKIPLTCDFKTKRIKVYLDSHKVPGWNEIDAVGLTDRRGKTQWAVDAEASSTYGDGSRGIVLRGSVLQGNVIKYGSEPMVIFDDTR